MGALTVTITQQHAVNPAVGVTLEQRHVQIARQQQLATVVEASPAGSVTLQADSPYVPTVIPAAERIAVIRFDSTYDTVLTSGNAVVTIFGGLVVGGVRESFETVNRNLRALQATINYEPDGTLASIDYATASGGSIHKQFGYAQGVLTTITLSGDVPGGVSLVKHLSYEAGRLTEITYS